VDPRTGKARIELVVDEGPQYVVSDLTIAGNQYLTTERLERYFRTESGGLLRTLGIGGGEAGGEIVGRPFDQSAFDAAISEIQLGYANEGYIFAQVAPSVVKEEPAT